MSSYGSGVFPRYPSDGHPSYAAIGSACLRSASRTGALPCPSDVVGGIGDWLANAKRTTTLPGFTIGAVAGALGGLAVGLIFTGLSD